jgi:hypothetical protein
MSDQATIEELDGVLTFAITRVSNSTGNLAAVGDRTTEVAGAVCDGYSRTLLRRSATCVR